MPYESDNELKEVYYDQYCPKCKHWEKDAMDEPCDHCLDNPFNEHSHKPVDFKEAGKK